MQTLPDAVVVREILGRCDGASLMQAALCSKALYRLYRQCPRVTLYAAALDAAAMGYVELLGSLGALCCMETRLRALEEAVKHGKLDAMTLCYKHLLTRQDLDMNKGMDANVVRLYVLATAFSQPDVYVLLVSWRNSKLTDLLPTMHLQAYCSCLLAGATDRIVYSDTETLAYTFCSRSEQIFQEAVEHIASPPAMILSVVLLLLSEARYPRLMESAEKAIERFSVLYRSVENSAPLADLSFRGLLKSVATGPFYALAKDFAYMEVLHAPMKTVSHHFAHHILYYAFSLADYELAKQFYYSLDKEDCIHVCESLPARARMFYMWNLGQNYL